jgi:EmrB/QacA subfamily drug resistance transporter
MATTVAATRGNAERAKVLTLLVLCAAMFLDSLDTSLVAVALPGIKADLGMSTGSAQWLISGYTVAYGGFLLLGGRLADLFGRRRMFLVSMVLFAAASLAGGVVSDPGLLIATRLIKGLAAALTAPAALSLITTRFHEGPDRNRAMAFYAATAASGYSLGLVFSGLLTEASWRLIFFMPVVVAVLVIVATPFVISEPASGQHVRRAYDMGGALTVTAGVLLLIYAMVNAPDRGWGAPTTVVSFVVAVLLLVAFVVIELRHRDPAVPLRLFRSWTRSSGYLLALMFGCASLGWQFVATLYLQQYLGYSPLRTAVAILPLGLIILLVAQFVTSRLLSRVSTRWICGVGFLIQGAGIFLFTFVGVVGNYPGLMLPGMILHAIGNGLTFPTINIAGVSGVEDEEQGIASGMVTASLQVGVGIGVAVVSGVITAATTGPSPEAQVHGYSAAFVTATCFSIVASLIGFIGLRFKLGGASPQPGTETGLEPAPA